MKKLLVFIAFAAFCFVGADAQKQIGGDKILEVNFAPLGGNPVSISGIKARIFTEETTCFRVNLFVGSSTDKTVTEQPNTLPFGADEDDQLNPELYDIMRTFDFTIQPGIEFHMDGTDRVSPYVGAVVDFGTGSSSMESEMWGANDIDNFNEPAKFISWSRTETNGYTRIGLFGVAGVDVYVVDNVYLGAELGLGFSSTSERDTEYEYSDAVAWSLMVSAGADDSVDPEPALVNGSQFNFGPIVNAALRLGWIFAQ